MSSFFVNKEIYKARLEVCKDCEYYFKPTGTCKRCGCFMRIKASISVMKCPEKKWLETGVTQKVDDIPKHLMKEIKDVWKDMKTGKAKDIETKKRAVTLYNTIHGTGYRETTSCSSCLNTVYEFIKSKNE